jgi:hypothetical protein
MLFSQSLNIDWVKGMGSIDSEYSGNIKKISTGDLIIAGNFYNSVDFDPSAATNTQTSVGQSDLYFARFDQSGNLVYVKTFGGTWYDYLSSMETDQNDNIYLSGYFSGTVDFDPSANTFNLLPTGTNNCFFAKYDANGNLIYAKSLSCSDLFSISDSKVDSNGNIIIVGSFSGTLDFDPSPAVLAYTDNVSIPFVAKYNSTGDLVFAFCLEDPGFNANSVHRLELDDNNNIYVAGNFATTTDFDPGTPLVNLPCSGDQDVFFAKYDSGGNYIFAKSIVSNATGFNFIRKIALDNSGNIYVAGLLDGGLTGVNFDTSLTNYTLNTATYEMTFIAKYTNTGNVINAKAYEVSLGNMIDVSTLYFDNMNNLYVVGIYQNQVDFDLSAGVVPAQSLSYSIDAFVAAYDPNWNYLFSGTIGGPDNDRISAAVIDGSGTVFLTGSYSHICSFDPFAGGPILPSNGSYDLFIAKYTAPALLIKNEEGSSVFAFPNPFSDALYLNNISVDSDIRLINELGMPVLSTNTSAGNSINTQSLASGCYIVELSSQGKTSRSKMIKY